jgi:hypothetical protein
MVNDKVVMDLDKIVKERTAVKNDKKKYSVDEMRQMDIEDTLLDKIRNKGQPTFMDMLTYKMLVDDKKKTPDIDIEKIIERATQPFRDEIAEMKRKFDKAEEDKKYNDLRDEIKDLKQSVFAGSKKDDENPVMKKIEALENELKDTKEKERKREDERRYNDILSEIASLREDRAALLQNKESGDFIDQLIEFEGKKRNVVKALGLSKSDEEKLGIADVVDAFIDKAPKVAKTASSIRDIFSKDDNIPDDIDSLDDIPTELPQRAKNVKYEDSIPADIRAFLNQGTIKDNQFIDLTGTAWTNEKSDPLSKRDIEDLSYTNPELVRNLMTQAKEEYATMQEEKKAQQRQKEALPDKYVPTISTDNEPPKPDSIPAKPKKPIPEPIPDIDPAADEEDTDEAKAMKYLNAGSEMEIEDGKKAWVGSKSEGYFNNDDTPMTKEQLIEEVKKDPKVFLMEMDKTLNSMGEIDDDDGQE